MRIAGKPIQDFLAPVSLQQIIYVNTYLGKLPGLVQSGGVH